MDSPRDRPRSLGLTGATSPDASLPTLSHPRSLVTTMSPTLDSASPSRSRAPLRGLGTESMPIVFVKGSISTSPRTTVLPVPLLSSTAAPSRRIQTPGNAGPGLALSGVPVASPRAPLTPLPGLSSAPPLPVLGSGPIVLSVSSPSPYSPYQNSPRPRAAEAIPPSFSSPSANTAARRERGVSPYAQAYYSPDAVVTASTEAIVHASARAATHSANFVSVMTAARAEDIPVASRSEILHLTTTTTTTTTTPTASNNITTPRSPTTLMTGRSPNNQFAQLQNSPGPIRGDPLPLHASTRLGVVGLRSASPAANTAAALTAMLLIHSEGVATARAASPAPEVRVRTASPAPEIRVLSEKQHSPSPPSSSSPPSFIVLSPAPPPPAPPALIDPLTRVAHARSNHPERARALSPSLAKLSRDEELEAASSTERPSRPRPSSASKPASPSVESVLQAAGLEPHNIAETLSTIAQVKKTTVAPTSETVAFKDMAELIALESAREDLKKTRQASSPSALAFAPPLVDDVLAAAASPDRPLKPRPSSNSRRNLVPGANPAIEALRGSGLLGHDVVDANATPLPVDAAPAEVTARALSPPARSLVLQAAASPDRPSSPRPASSRRLTTLPTASDVLVAAGVTRVRSSSPSSSLSIQRDRSVSPASSTFSNIQRDEQNSTPKSVDIGVVDVIGGSGVGSAVTQDVSRQSSPPPPPKPSSPRPSSQPPPPQQQPPPEQPPQEPQAVSEKPKKPKPRLAAAASAVIGTLAAPPSAFVAAAAAISKKPPPRVPAAISTSGSSFPPASPPIALSAQRAALLQPQLVAALAAAARATVGPPSAPPVVIALPGLGPVVVTLDMVSRFTLPMLLVLAECAEEAYGEAPEHAASMRAGAASKAVEDAASAARASVNADKIAAEALEAEQAAQAKAAAAPQITTLSTGAQVLKRAAEAAATQAADARALAAAASANVLAETLLGARASAARLESAIAAAAEAEAAEQLAAQHEAQQAAALVAAAVASDAAEAEAAARVRARLELAAIARHAEAEAATLAARAAADAAQQATLAQETADRAARLAAASQSATVAASREASASAAARAAVLLQTSTLGSQATAASAAAAEAASQLAALLSATAARAIAMEASLAAAEAADVAAAASHAAIRALSPPRFSRDEATALINGETQSQLSVSDLNARVADVVSYFAASSPHAYNTSSVLHRELVSSSSSSSTSASGNGNGNGDVPFSPPLPPMPNFRGRNRDLSPPVTTTTTTTASEDALAASTARSVIFSSIVPPPPASPPPSSNFTNFTSAYLTSTVATLPPEVQQESPNGGGAQILGLVGAVSPAPPPMPPRPMYPKPKAERLIAPVLVVPTTVSPSSSPQSGPAMMALESSATAALSTSPPSPPLVMMKPPSSASSSFEEENKGTLSMAPPTPAAVLAQLPSPLVLPTGTGTPIIAIPSSSIVPVSPILTTSSSTIVSSSTNSTSPSHSGPWAGRNATVPSAATPTAIMLPLGRLGTQAGSHVEIAGSWDGEKKNEIINKYTLVL